VSIGAKELFDFQILLYPLKETFVFPPGAVAISNGLCCQGEVVVQEFDTGLGATKICPGETLTGTDLWYWNRGHAVGS